ncbi:hypothetical protein KC331_g13 [Hortaea werneckii]|nr:hypothetical protein KC331_g13 [Hortaea werneckii]
MIRLAYPLYNVFLPQYLRTRGAQLGGLSEYEQRRNCAIANACGIPSPIVAGLMCRSGWFWGRRGTMIIGTLLTMAFLFAYTQVKNNAQNAGFTSAINFCLVPAVLRNAYIALASIFPLLASSQHPSTFCSLRIQKHHLSECLRNILRVRNLPYLLRSPEVHLESTSCDALLDPESWRRNGTCKPWKKELQQAKLDLDTLPRLPIFKNIYYGTLYAYTPEVLPSAHRGTGNGISIALNRVMGILSAVIATYADTSTPVPIYLCAAFRWGVGVHESKCECAQEWFIDVLQRGAIGLLRVYDDRLSKTHASAMTSISTNAPFFANPLTYHTDVDKRRKLTCTAVLTGHGSLRYRFVTSWIVGRRKCSSLLGPGIMNGSAYTVRPLGMLRLIRHWSKTITDLLASTPPSMISPVSGTSPIHPQTCNSPPAFKTGFQRVACRLVDGMVENRFIVIEFVVFGTISVVIQFAIIGSDIRVARVWQGADVGTEAIDFPIARNVKTRVSPDWTTGEALKRRLDALTNKELRTNSPDRLTRSSKAVRARDFSVTRKETNDREQRAHNNPCYNERESKRLCEVSGKLQQRESGDNVLSPSLERTPNRKSFKHRIVTYYLALATMPSNGGPRQVRFAVSDSPTVLSPTFRPGSMSPTMDRSGSRSPPPSMNVLSLNTDLPLARSPGWRLVMRQMLAEDEYGFGSRATGSNHRDRPSDQYQWDADDLASLRQDRMGRELERELSMAADLWEANQAAFEAAARAGAYGFADSDTVTIGQMLQRRFSTPVFMHGVDSAEDHDGDMDVVNADEDYDSDMHSHLAFGMEWQTPTSSTSSVDFEGAQETHRLSLEIPVAHSAAEIMSNSAGSEDNYMSDSSPISIPDSEVQPSTPVSDATDDSEWTTLTDARPSSAMHRLPGHPLAELPERSSGRKSDLVHCGFVSGAGALRRRWQDSA